MTATHTLFLPNDLLLCMFNEGYRSHYVRQTARPEANKLHVLFGAPHDSLPQLEVLRPAVHERDWYRVERTMTNDSLFYWITDSDMIKTDTIIVAMTYLRSNTDNDSLEMVTDTVRFGYRKPAAQVKEEQKRAKEREDRAKRLVQLLEKQEKAATQGKELNEGELEELKELQRPDPDETEKLKMELAKSGTFDIGDSIILKFDTPVASIDPGGVHLEIKRDTLWIPIEGRHIPQLINDCDPMRYWIPCTTLPDSTYRLIIDSAAVTSVYGLHNEPMSKELRVRGLEQYANVYFHVNVSDGAFVELLGSSEKVMRTVPVKNGAFELLNVNPNTYYLRLIIDSNGNGKWDTGNYLNHLQPEEVYYYPKKLRLRANWDLDEDWNIYQTALDLQKPEDIKRNKPEKAKNKVEKKQDKTEGDEEEDEFSTGINPNTYTGNKYDDTKRLNNRRINR